MHGGLSERDAATRLRTDGYNELPAAERRSPLRIAVEVLREPMFGLLVAAAAIYLVVGELAEAVSLFVFATISVSIAVVQETRSERVLEALRDLTSPRAVVIRDGVARRIAGREVVRGDLIVLAEGDRVPADATIVSGAEVHTDESILTGEAVPVLKRVATPSDREPVRPGGDDLPYVFSGSLVVRGNARAVVTATGARSEIGRIGKSLTTIESEPPRLRVQTRRLVQVFALAGLAVCLLTVVLYGTLRGTWIEAALAGIALGMSMLPEEIPLVLTVFMVMGAWRISQARVLTRRAAAIETLGAATVLCVDKTGTLTQNRMSVVCLQGGGVSWNSAEGGSPPPTDILNAAALASSSDGIDPMDRAIFDLGKTYGGGNGPDAVAIRRFGLTPDLLATVNVFRSPDGVMVAAAKGAPEAIGTLCRLSTAETSAMKRDVDAMAAEGIRVLAVARAEMPRGDAPASPRDISFRFVGLVGFQDPVRQTVPDAVRECRTAGIRVIMITGDYPATARAIALQAGIDPGEIITGSDLAALDDAALRRRVGSASVFARTLPEQKLRIVEALKANGEVVGMTGDGVNDAPSLKSAHIGVAMGARGTDVAREAASIVLLDDDFGSFVKTIRLGRRIYDNLRKAIGYIMAVHVPIAGLAVLPLVMGTPLVLTPMLIALLEMIIDPVCSVVLEAEDEERDIMARPPRHPETPLLSSDLMAWSAVQGALAFGIVSGVLLVASARGLPEAEVRSLAYFSLVTTNVALIFANRSFSASIWTAVARRNPSLWVGLVAIAGVLAVVSTWPPVQRLFRLGTPHWDDLAACLGTGVGLLMVLELLKPAFRPRAAPARLAD